MAKSEGITKPLAFIIGIAICYLIFNPPEALSTLGVGGYVIAVAAIVFAILGLCFYAVLKNLPAQVVLRQEHTANLPPELNRLSQEMTSLGFTQSSPNPFRVELSPPALLIPFVNEKEKTYATVFKTGSTPPTISYDFVSYLDGNRGTLTTSPNWHSGVIPGPKDSLKQSFLGLGVAALFERHRDGINYLKGKGLHCRAASKDTFERDFRASMIRLRKSFLASPLTSTVHAVIRTIQKKTPHVGAIQTQQEAQNQLRKMLHR